MISLPVAGCAAGLDSLPLPAPGLNSDSIVLTAEFSNALNLPAKAKVKLNGADIGEVSSIGTRDFNALAKLRIRADVPLYVGSTAELRSATPLGDLFVAIRPDPMPAADTSLLRDGDNIPRAGTTAAATIEDVLSSAALLVNGGVIRRLVTVTNGAGSAVGGRGDKVAELLRQSTLLVSRLNERTGQIDGALRNTSDLAAAITAQQETLNTALAAANPATSTIADNTNAIVDLTGAIARITDQLARFPSMKGTDTRSLIADLNRLSATFNAIAVDPNLSLTPLNTLVGPVMKATTGTGGAVNAVVAKLALGSLPDKNYPGDPGFHGPDGTDYHAMIGSLRYQWNLMLSKVMGGDR
ncbi:MlaD family protein [Mycobacteroides stephanolepidis]|nr:MlaD family protein [[Mycobacterium] stephanolepidis]